MEYLYGKLNKEIQSVKYTGGESGTAVVNVDNVKKVITVDVKPTNNDSGLPEAPTHDGLYSLKVYVANGQPRYMWVQE